MLETKALDDPQRLLGLSGGVTVLSRIIVGRGGGSDSDLQAFSNERVAEAKSRSTSVAYVVGAARTDPVSVCVSSSMIASRLDEFEEAGLVSRTQYNEIPPRVEYHLTGDGNEVRRRLEPLLEWATAEE